MATPLSLDDAVNSVAQLLPEDQEITEITVEYVDANSAEVTLSNTSTGFTFSAVVNELDG